MATEIMCARTSVPGTAANAVMMNAVNVIGSYHRRVESLSVLVRASLG